jgi:outer membrane autotransporter protein
MLTASAFAGLLGATAAHAQLVGGLATTSSTTTLTGQIDLGGTPALDPLRLNLSAVPAAQGQASVAQLVPGGYSLLPEATLRAADIQEIVIRRYLRDYRAGGAGPSSGEDTPRKLGGALWAEGTGRHTRLNAAPDRPRTTIGSVGGIGGFDIRASGRSLLGVYGGYEHEDLRFDDFGPASAIKSWFAGGYGTVAVGPVYIDAFGSYGQSRYNLRRLFNVGLTDPNTGLPASTFDFATNTRGHTWLAGGTAGLQFIFSGVEVEPFAGVRYANLTIDEFSEGGAAGAIGLPRRKYESLLGNFGARLGLNYQTGETVIRPEIRGAWRHEFLHDASDFNSYTFGGLGPNVGFTPNVLPRDYATVAAGFSISGKQSPVSFVVDYNGEFGKGRQSHGITGGLRLAF